MRAAMDRATSPWLIEVACFLLRRTPLKAVAREIFFGSGSFPDVRPDQSLRYPQLCSRSLSSNQRSPMSLR